MDHKFDTTTSFFRYVAKNEAEKAENTWSAERLERAYRIQCRQYNSKWEPTLDENGNEQKDGEGRTITHFVESDPTFSIEWHGRADYSGYRSHERYILPEEMGKIFFTHVVAENGYAEWRLDTEIWPLTDKKDKYSNPSSHTMVWMRNKIAKLNPGLAEAVKINVANEMEAERLANIEAWKQSLVKKVDELIKDSIELIARPGQVLKEADLNLLLEFKNRIYGNLESRLVAEGTITVEEAETSLATKAEAEVIATNKAANEKHIADTDLTDEETTMILVSKRGGARFEIIAKDTGRYQIKEIGTSYTRWINLASMDKFYTVEA